MQEFKSGIKDFISTVIWTYAKTMQEWPHEYIVRGKVDEKLFKETVNHIRGFGYDGYYYDDIYTYFEENEILYWTMGEPIDKTTIINRCKKEDSYESRLKNNTLPKIKY